MRSPNFILLSLILLSLPLSSGLQMGDINKDGDVDIADVVYLFKNRDVPVEEGDLNCDGSVDIADV
ncbi:ABC transporter substrate-binding protein, partial [Methanothermococcus sp. SCGC AD-155-E23]|nr:ABC transporter substrate-binding protein [Methanothermococcus sp. SCGC AD-155-E23]